jgi:membrane protease YdiL (CAAX protease family)
LAVVAFLALASYAGRFTGRIESLPADIFFRYSTAIATVVVDGILLVLLVLIAMGLPFREAFALRAPRSWGRAALIGAATLVSAYAVAFAIAGLLPHLVREQSVPEFWDPSRLGAWAANLFVIAIFVPVFEEALCRGLGYTLLEPLGTPAAIGLTAIAFTLAHGVVVDIPVILATGVGLGYMRAWTGSLLPCIGLHAVFNGLGLAAAALIGR